MITNYFQDTNMGFALKNVTTDWQLLEVRIAVGCSFSPFIRERQVVGSVYLPAGRQQLVCNMPATYCPMHILATEEAGWAHHLGQDEIQAPEVKEPLITKIGEERQSPSPLDGKTS